MNFKNARKCEYRKMFSDPGHTDQWQRIGSYMLKYARKVLLASERMNADGDSTGRLRIWAGIA